MGVWGAQNASKPSENIINTPPKYPQTHLETFFSGHFSPQIARKRLSPQAPPLQATRPRVASQRVVRTQNGVWRAQNVSKPSKNIINTPPTYHQTHLETFFLDHSSPPIAQKRLSPQTPALAGY